MNKKSKTHTAILNNIPEKLIQKMLQNPDALFLQQSKKHWPMKSRQAGVIEKSVQRNKFDHLASACSDLGIVMLWVDAVNHKIKASCGVKELLGYKEDSFSMEQYIKITAPIHFVPWVLYEYFLREIMMSGEHELKFMSDRFVSNVNIRKADQKYINMRKSNYVFQIDRNGCVTEYLIIMVSPDNETPDRYTMDGISRNLSSIELTNNLKEYVRHAFIHANNFSKKQKELLAHISKVSTGQLKDYNNIASTSDWHKENITSQARLIRKKIESYIPPFTDSISCLKYLRECSLI